MKNLYIILLLNLLTYTVFSQGGDNAASAAASPITIPFTAAGSTAPGSVNDDYTFPTGYASGYTQGPDWLYYFCAPANNTVLVSLSFTASTSSPVLPSLSVWQGGAPGVGTVVDTVAVFGMDNNVEALSFPVTAGTCYYIMVDNWPAYASGFPYTISVSYPPTPSLQPACTNIGYDNGNFTGWLGEWGYTVTTSAPSAQIPDFTPNTFNTTSTQHTITSGAATDPLAGFPKVCPGLGPNSMRLGDGATGGYGGSSIEQKFTVAASNALFTYHYAVVITDAVNPVPMLGVDGTDSLDAFGSVVYYQNYTNTGDSVTRHPANQQPYFKVDLFDCNGLPLTCGQYLVVGGAGIPGFTQIGTSNTYYKNWTSVFIDLTPYIGSCVTVKYTVADCSLGAHYCYAYIDAICAPMAITGTNNICPGSSTTLSAPIGGESYAWTIQGSSTVIGTGQTLTASPVVNTIYVCNITSVTGCNTQLTYPVNVYPVVTATSTSTTVCQGVTGSINCTASPAGGTYSWTNGGGITSSVTQTPASTTIYTCTYTDLDGCTDTAIGTIYVNPLPIAPPTTPVTYCQNQTPNSLTSSVTPSAGCTINWYGTTSGGVPTSTPPTVSTATAGPTTYYVSQTNTATGCTGPQSTITVTVNPLPIITVNSPSTCAGIAVTLTANSTIAGSSFSWSTTPTQTGSSISVSPLVPTSYTVTGTSPLGCSNAATSNVSINGSLNLTVNDTTICNGGTAILTAAGATNYSWASGETTASITVTPSATTTYSVTGTTAGCTGTVTSTVTVNPVPTVSVNSSTICNGQSVNVVATPSIGGGSYSWSPVSPLTQTISVSPSTTTNYTVTYTLNGCLNTGTGTITVNPVPTVTVTNDQICAGESGSLVATPSLLGGAYLWTPTNLTASSITQSPINTTTYNVAYTLNGCVANGSGIITVNPLPLVDAGLNQVACIGSMVTLTATGASTYSWDNGVSNGVPFAPVSTLTYTVTGTSSFGCVATDNVTVTVEQLPVVSFVPSDTFGCAPLNVIFTNTTPGVTNCVWTISDGTTLFGCSSVSHIFNQAGCFDITLTTSSANGCTNSLTESSLVCVEAPPVAAFSVSPNVMPNYATHCNMSNNSSGAVNYLWNFGDGTNSTDVNPGHIFPGTEEMDYQIRLIAYSPSGCVDTAYATVTIYEETIFYVPNTFTPDGDDFNEIFKPVFTSGFDPDDYTLLIFNRWGELIFESHNVDVGWKGTYGTDSKIVQDGTYTWKIIYKHKNDKRKNVVVGHVNVLK
ncbi:MAG: gliding motility-associated C-terminal domain-containing protein [Flavobacteriia bacterium]|nr:gliding motility-associated C-terminal domain-containing protein [Flavobacteriia bacterium]